MRAACRKLGLRVRELRRAAEQTQEQLAQLARLDAKHLQLIESGKTNTTIASLVGIAHALDVKLSVLLEGV